MSGEHNYKIVMPFVTVASNGGPHDDVSYVAGWAMGRLDHVLESMNKLGNIHWASDQLFRVENVPQMDLIAMRHGFVCESKEHADSGWVIAKFIRQTYESL